MSKKKDVICGEYFLKERLVDTVMTIYTSNDGYQSLNNNFDNYVEGTKKVKDVVFCDDYDNSWYEIIFDDDTECRMCP